MSVIGWQRVRQEDVPGDQFRGSLASQGNGAKIEWLDPRYHRPIPGRASRPAFRGAARPELQLKPPPGRSTGIVMCEIARQIVILQAGDGQDRLPVELGVISPLRRWIPPGPEVARHTPIRPVHLA